MNKALLIFLFSFLVIAGCFAQQKPPKVFGTVYIDNSTLMAQTEVTIKDWIGFIVNNNFDASLFPDSTSISPTDRIVFNDLRKRNGFEYLQIINEEEWIESGLKGVTTMKKFKTLTDADTNYFSLDIPITGITFEQAGKFCKWKEDLISQHKKVGVNVSLPSVGVYKKVIPNIDTLSKNGNCFLLNCSTAKCKASEKNKMGLTQGKALEHVRSYFPTILGVYNIQGNAAEMTDTYGIAMGGSFRQTARESYNDKNQPYTKAEGWLGFRYVVTLK